MRTEEWILVEDTFTDSLSVSSLPESLGDVDVTILQIRERDFPDLLQTMIHPEYQERLDACYDGNQISEEEHDNLNVDIEIQKPSIIDVPSLVARKHFELHRPIRMLSKLSIISPRIDPKLGRLAALHLRAGNLVGCIYKPDIDAQRSSLRFKDRASLLLKAN